MTGRRKRQGPVKPTGPAMPDVASKCGWCLTGHHEQCQPSVTSTLTGATYRCPCNHGEV